MSFTEYPYKRPSMEGLKEKLELAIQAFEQGKTVAEQSREIERINALRNDYISMMNICLIRHTMDTNNAFYESENSFFDAAGPTYEKLNTSFYQALIQSPFKERTQ